AKTVSRNRIKGAAPVPTGNHTPALLLRALLILLATLITSQSLASNRPIRLTYDSDGNRVRKEVRDGAGAYAAIQYLVDTMNPTGLPQVVEELSGTGTANVSRRYYYGLEPIAVDIVNGGSTERSFYGYDGQGSVRFLMNAAGEVTDSYDYAAFGNLVHREGTTPLTRLFMAEEWDQDLGLYYLRARYYDPDTGRFFTMDPFFGFLTQPEGLHKYAYAN